MKQFDDPWYVRLPDGKVKRAVSTVALRQRLERGKIPLGSHVRRSRNDEWTALEWTAEFNEVVADLRARNHSKPTPLPREPLAVVAPVLSPRASVSSRLDPQQLQTVGVQLWITELVAALDSVLVAKKLLTAGLGSLFFGVVLALWRTGLLDLEVSGYGLGATMTGAALVLVFALSSALLLQLSHVEVTALRAARWPEALHGWTSLTFRLVLGFLLVLGSVVVLLGGLVQLSNWLLMNVTPPWGVYREFGATLAGVAIVLASVALLPLFCFSLLLGPILVVERCSIWKAFGLWRKLLRRHLGRVLAFEILALSLGLLITLPFALPVVLVSWLPLDHRLHGVKSLLTDLLAGVSTAPLLAYLTVANLFIFLNLQYGTTETRGVARH